RLTVPRRSSLFSSSPGLLLEWILEGVDLEWRGEKSCIVWCNAPLRTGNHQSIHQSQTGPHPVDRNHSIVEENESTVDVREETPIAGTANHTMALSEIRREPSADCQACGFDARR